MRRNLTTALVITAALNAVAMPAAAQGIYRCGDSYSQKPCPGGKEVQADDPRSASQRSEAMLAAQRDAKSADAMEKARVKEEAKPVQAFIPIAKPQDTASNDSKAATATKAKKAAHFTAVAPKKPDETKTKKKKKAKKKSA